ncbi:homer protein homolog 3b isoform X1 [Tachysurus fulvidraco]|uniref:homer protein homolog 3b isoform X1 n=1 Tax=Tachysurus fulvidraco TaxID=1234273 RepID=UPI000F516031|nr:homer protein homolog 3b isoform X1 [Tachysurus fulvidraco]
MGEQPLFSTKAHVFQIDPATKRNWIPASKHAVTVSFFFDANRTVYRIISVGGTKAIINSTVTPNMTFTKTSQKFGQWADSRANTVYGLGFSTEQHLQQFSEQFKEVKEAARLVREKSQEKFELICPGLNIDPLQALSGDRRSLTALLCVNGSGEDKLFRSKSADLELAMKKECVKKIRSEGSICEVSMEAELFTLRKSNAKLVAALREANSSIEQWKNQLSEYQQETHRLRDQEFPATEQRFVASELSTALTCGFEEPCVAELEEQSGHSAASENKTEDLFQSVEDMEALLMAKDEEINKLQGRKSDFQDLVEEREEIYKRMQELEQRNLELEQQVQKAEQNLASSMEARQQTEGQVRKVIEVLDVKIFDLNNLRQSLDNFLNK